MADTVDLSKFKSGKVYVATELHVFEPVGDVPTYFSGAEPPHPPAGVYKRCRVKIEDGLLFVQLDERGEGQGRVDVYPISQLKAVIGLYED
jgi:hypothetical protein